MTDKLDEETEAAIAELDRTARVSDACECYLIPGALADDPCIHVRENAEAESALRQRIRVLVEEAGVGVLTPEEARVLCQLEDEAHTLFEAEVVRAAFAKMRRLAGNGSPLAIEKEQHPERFCLEKECLWRVRGVNGPLVSRETGLPAGCPAHPQSALSIKANGS